MHLFTIASWVVESLSVAKQFPILLLLKVSKS